MILRQLLVSGFLSCGCSRFDIGMWSFHFLHSAWSILISILRNHYLLHLNSFNFYLVLSGTDLLLCFTRTGISAGVSFLNNSTALKIGCKKIWHNQTALCGSRSFVNNSPSLKLRRMIKTNDPDALSG